MVPPLLRNQTPTDRGLLLPDARATSEYAVQRPSGTAAMKRMAPSLIHRHGIAEPTPRAGHMGVFLAVSSSSSDLRRSVRTTGVITFPPLASRLKMAGEACWLGPVHEEDLLVELAPLLAFMGAQPLTQAISELEASLGGRRADEIPATLRRHDVSPRLLRSAFVARERFGRINDVIHATAIALALPTLLEDGEILKRPSLAAGNDPSRPFDVETDRRVAEFKFSRWDGHDAGRKRQLFKDLVHLAAADLNGRRVATVRSRFAAHYFSPDDRLDRWMGAQPHG
jgi:hypothetical protein